MTRSTHNITFCRALTRKSVGVLPLADRERLTSWIPRVAAYCGVSLRRFAVLPSELLVLIRVPSRQHVTLDELHARCCAIYAEEEADRRISRIRYLYDIGDREGARKLRDKVTRRMYTVPGFLQLVKQTFSNRYNRAHDRQGPVWAVGSYQRSIHSEDARETVELFIDLAPVEQGIVDYPQEYPYCTLGATV